MLAIGGLDPGGGAGILADARAVARAGAFGCAVATVLTVQSTSGMRSATSVARREVIASCTEVLKHQDVRAIKVGALGSDDNASAVADLLAIHRRLPAIVDPVMMPTRGRARLLEEKAVGVLRKRVLPRATLVTVNAPEAEVLTGLRVTRLDEALDAANAMLRLGARAVLLKGGHLGGPDAVDLLVFATTDTPAPAKSSRNVNTQVRAAALPPRVVELSARRLRLPATHGGGCILASLIAGRLAAHDDDGDIETRLVNAVRWAKRVHHEALAKSSSVGGDLRVLFA